jgi:CDP-diglyceride synthetase
MIAGFFTAMFSGHIYVIAIVTTVQIMSFKEVIAIANVPSKEKNLQFTKSLNWYFLATTMYFLYGESVIYYFKHVLLVDRVLLPFATHHRFISFTLYVMGEFQSLRSSAPKKSSGHVLISVQGLSSSSQHCKRATTSSNLHNSHGPTWLSI